MHSFVDITRGTASTRLSSHKDILEAIYMRKVEIEKLLHNIFKRIYVKLIRNEYPGTVEVLSGSLLLVSTHRQQKMVKTRAQKGQRCDLLNERTH